MERHNDWDEALKAIEEDEISVFEALLDKDEKLIRSKGTYKFWQGEHWTLLHIAIINNKENIVEALLSRGADANGDRRHFEQMEAYWSPLHLAAVNFPDIAKKLIAKEAEVDVFVMASMGMIDNLKLSLEHNPEMIRQRGPDGAFPLHLAAACGQEEVVQHLLSVGADLHARDLVRHETPLEWARGNQEMLRLLNDAGAKVSPISGIAVIVIYVSNVKKSVEFYSKILGFHVNHFNEDWADMSLSGISFGLQKKEDLVGGGSPLISLKTYYLPELSTKLLELSESNPDFKEIIVGEVQKSAYGDSLLIRDPDGNNINLYMPK